jgi:membrane protein implicated in regulation of membrane protease activity
MVAPRPRPDRRVLLRYAALQVPGQAFVLLLAIAGWEWLGVPGWTVWAVPLAWALKDALLFPFVWRAYEPDDRFASAGLVGSTAVVEEPLAPSGWARIGPELWRAELAAGAETAPRGALVRIVRVDGLVLLVEPVDAYSGPGTGAASAAPSTSTRSSSSQSS